MALSLWLVNKNNNQNKLYWVLFILGLPFIGSTAYFINYLIQE
ncbi:PLDc N-terminal domain-containing protein [Lacinutrix neustonica]